MIYVRPTSPHTFHPCGRPGVHKVFFKACNSDEKQTQGRTEDTSDKGQVFVERAPIHFEDNDEFAKLALDVAGFNPEDVEVRGLDFDANVTYEKAKAEIIAADKAHAGIK